MAPIDQGTKASHVPDNATAARIWVRRRPGDRGR